MPSKIRPAPSNSEVGKRGIRHQNLRKRRSPASASNIISWMRVMSYRVRAGWGGHLPVAAPSNDNRIDSTVSLSIASRVHAHAIGVRPRQHKRTSPACAQKVCFATPA